MNQECPFCHADVVNILRHVPDCEHAPSEARQDAADTIKRREAYAQAPIVCCALRKKVLLSPSVFSEQDCGISDSELLDVMTFSVAAGRDVVAFRYCPWCGKPWVTTGIEIY